MAQLKYEKAVQRIDEIIEKIEGEDIAIDDLAAKVKEAVDLITACRAKIEQAEAKVEQVVKGFADDPN